MSVTLCITAFNERENLNELIKDLTWLHAQEIGLQVVIVDNGSTDDTWRTLQVESLEHGEMAFHRSSGRKSRIWRRAPVRY